MEVEIDHVARISWQYKKFENVFNGTYADSLPPHRSFDHAIDLKPGKEPPFGPLYSLSQKELEILREYLKKMLASGKISPSKSPAGSPVLFVPKPHGRGLRLCVDYRGLNKVTIANRYALPLMNELRDRVQGAKIFTKIDLKAGFHLIRIKKGDEWKTAFRTRYGHFQYNVLPFGLENAPATFQNMMNDILRDMLDAGTVVYIDDILIYSETEEQHVELVREVLSRLEKHSLAIEPEKCFWQQEKVDFLGYVVSAKGIEMATDQVETILKWREPQNVTYVQSFLGVCQFLLTIHTRLLEGSETAYRFDE